MTFPPLVLSVPRPAFDDDEFQAWAEHLYRFHHEMTLHIQANREQMLTDDDTGSGNGLDADTVDGLEAAAFALASLTLTAGSGLTGGGTLAADRSFALDINGLTAETAPAEADTVAIYDATATALRKVTLANFRPLIYATCIILSPGASENRTILPRVERALEIVAVNPVLIGSSTPSVTFNLSHGTDRSGGGSQVFSSGQVVTNVTTGDNLTSFSDPVLTADEHLWLTTSAQSGTVDELAVLVALKETGA